MRAPVTVVSGLPRSGTSMMMRALEAGGTPPLTDGARPADSDNPRGYYELEAVKRTREDASWVVRATGKAVKLVHLLLYDLPPGYAYRVVLMRRPIDEVIASQAAMLERLGEPPPALPRDRLAAEFERQLAEVEAWLARQPNFSVRRVEYHRVLAQPRAELEAVTAFLGGRLDVEAMVRVIDPALHRIRRRSDEPRP